VHTNDAPSTVTRLIDIGLEPYLVSSSLLLVIAQRLVRTLCPSCKGWTEPNDVEVSQLCGMGLDVSTLQDGMIAKSEGCSECFNSGYQGRTAIYEMLPMAEKVRALVTEQATASALKRVAVQELGMRTLRQDALQKMIDGITSPEEVMRVTQLDVL